MRESTDLDVSLLSLLQGEALANPSILYRQLYATSPIFWDTQIQSWVVARYADVTAIIQSPHISSARILPTFNRIPSEMREAVRPVFDKLARQVTFLDPPDHTRVRGLLNKAFTPRTVERMRAGIEQIVNDLLDQVQTARQMDLVRDFGYPLPVIVVADLLGVPRADLPQIKKWVDDFFVFLASSQVTSERIEEALCGVTEYVAYFHDLVADHQAHPRDDLLTALSNAEEHGARFDEDDLSANCLLLLTAGHETTTHMICNGVLTLLQHPDQLQQLREDPTLIKSAIEEMLRYESPTRALRRLVKDDFEFNGQKLERGQTIMLLIGATHRDAARFPDPDRFDIRRADNRHLAFLHGLHFCLGAPLARLEGQIAINTLLRRLPDLRLATDTPDWSPHIFFRGLKSLPVVF